MDAPQAIVPTAEERSNGHFQPKTLCDVLSALTQDGVVLLQSVIDVRHLDAINEKMCGEVDDILSDPDKVFNFGIKSNFLQRPPVDETSLLYEDVYFNPFVLQIANAYLGQRPTFNWITSNNALAKTAGVRQPVHKDNDYVHPEFPYYFIANIPLIDFSIANGATEFWLGSHATTSHLDQVKATEKDREAYPFARDGQPIPPVTQDAIAARQAIRPPVQPICRRGDVMIRDLRVWHAGMPNNSDEHRIMLGLGYQSPHYPNATQRCYLPEKQREFWEGRGGVELRAEFLSDEDFKKTSKDTDFSPRPAYL